MKLTVIFVCLLLSSTLTPITSEKSDISLEKDGLNRNHVFHRRSEKAYGLFDLIIMLIMRIDFKSLGKYTLYLMIFGFVWHCCMLAVKDVQNERKRTEAVKDLMKEVQMEIKRNEQQNDAKRSKKQQQSKIKKTKKGRR